LAALVLVACLTPGPRAGVAAKDPLADLGDRLKDMTPAGQISYLDSLLKKGTDDARIHFFKGNAFFSTEQYDSSIAEFRRAVEMDEDYSKAYVNLGIVYDQTGKRQNARSAYGQAIRVNPDDVLAYCHLGYNYYSSGDHARAMEYYTKALEIDPNSAQAHYNLGLAFAEAKIFKEALVEWRRVIELDPDGQLGKMAAENVKLIETYMELGN
jgi:tetratricopeptide (TPR) repeat protein